MQIRSCTIMCRRKVILDFFEDLCDNFAYSFTKVSCEYKSDRIQSCTNLCYTDRKVLEGSNQIHEIANHLRVSPMRNERC